MADKEEKNIECSYTACIDRLRRIGMTPKDQPQHEALVRASVLVPLFRKANDDAIHMLLTKRPERLRTHSGEVCFPGGKQDPEDLKDDVLTALRETYEEVGIASEDVTPICRLATLESYTGLCVTPIVGVVHPAPDLSTLIVSKEEVEIAFTVPLAYFADDNNLTSKQEVEWRGGTFELRTYYYNDCNSGRTFQIWGLTAYIAHQVALLAFNGHNTIGSLVQNTTNGQQSTTSGYLYRLVSDDGRKPYWVRKFFVLEGQLLHQYDSESQSRRRAATATKKNRLTLMESSTVEPILSTSDDSKHEFVIKSLHGRIQWHLGAETDIERERWMGAIGRHR